MQFRELTDMQWELIRPSLPRQAYTGRPRANDRIVINGILYVLMSGCRWMDMPSKYGSYKTVWERHKKWSEKGIWKRIIMDSLVSYGYQKGLVDAEDLSVDSSTVPAKKGSGRRLATMVTRRRKEAKYICCSDSPSHYQSQ
jgi:transposase